MELTRSTKDKLLQQTSHCDSTNLVGHYSLRKIVSTKVLNILPLCVCILGASGIEPLPPLQINSGLDHRAFLLDDRFRSHEPTIKVFQYVTGGFLVGNFSNKIPLEGVSISATGEKIIGESSNDSTNQTRANEAKNIHQGGVEFVHCLIAAIIAGLVSARLTEMLARRRNRK